MEKPNKFDPSKFRSSDLGCVGYLYFSLASRECPASITAQAALIAFWCLGSELYQPGTLYDSLVQNPSRIRVLTKVANKIHRERGRGPEVDEDEIVRVVDNVFPLAQRMMNVGVFELEYISSSLYQKYMKGSQDIPIQDKEAKFRTDMEDRLTKEFPQFDLPRYLSR